MCGHTRDPIIYSKFHRNPFKGFGTLGGQNLALPITLASRFYNSLYYRTSRDIYIRGVFQGLTEPTKPTAPRPLLSLYGIIYVTWYASGLPEATGVKTAVA